MPFDSPLPHVSSPSVRGDIEAIIRKLQPAIRLRQTQDWLAAQVPPAHSTQWTSDDAERLLVKVQRLDARREMSGRSPLSDSDWERALALQFTGFGSDRTGELCWSCRGSIVSEIDARCDSCNMFFCDLWRLHVWARLRVTTELARTPRPPGRPSRLPAARALFFEALDEGANRAEAIFYAGIGTSTFYRWMADPRPEYREFRAAVERAESERERAQINGTFRLKAIRHVFLRSDRSVHAALRWLQYSDPERWAPYPREPLPRQRRRKARDAPDAGRAGALQHPMVDSSPPGERPVAGTAGPSNPTRDPDAVAIPISSFSPEIQRVFLDAMEGQSRQKDRGSRDELRSWRDRD